MRVAKLVTIERRSGSVWQFSRAEPNLKLTDEKLRQQIRDSKTITMDLATLMNLYIYHILSLQLMAKLHTTHDRSYERHF